MQLRQEKNTGMTLVELLVVIAILGIFMGIAIPTVTRSFRAMGQAKRMTSRYPDAWRALDKVSNMLRQTYPAALASGGTFVGRNSSYDAGGVKIPFDELSFPVLDTGYAHLGSVQKISYRLELTPEEEESPRGLVQTRSSLGAAAEAGTKETLAQMAMGLDFRYLDDSVEPPEWVQQWPPVSAPEVSASEGSASKVVTAGGGDQPPASEAMTPQSVRLPKAVKITIFMLQEISPQPTSFATVVNLPSS